MVNVCVLKYSAEYQPRHVQWLAKQVPDLVCLSDVDVPGVETIALRYDWPKWWAKLELFRPDIQDDLMFYDLDTVVKKPLNPTPKTSLMLRDFYNPDRSGSGLMYIRHQDKAAVWDAWLKSQDTKYKPTKAHHGDQGFIWDYLKHEAWQDHYPGAVASYKVHIKRGKMQDADVICFHGKPRPWEITASWIPPL